MMSQIDIGCMLHWPRMGWRYIFRSAIATANENIMMRFKVHPTHHMSEGISQVVPSMKFQVITSCRYSSTHSPTQFEVSAVLFSLLSQGRTRVLYSQRFKYEYRMREH